VHSRYQSKNAPPNPSDAIGGAYSTKQLERMDARFIAAVERGHRRRRREPAI
jgi:hypothetical protein